MSVKTKSLVITKASLLKLGREVSELLGGMFIEVYADDGCEEVTIWNSPEAVVEDARRFIFKANRFRAASSLLSVSLEISRHSLERWMDEDFATSAIGGNFRKAMKAT